MIVQTLPSDFRGQTHGEKLPSALSPCFEMIYPANKYHLRIVAIHSCTFSIDDDLRKGILTFDRNAGGLNIIDECHAKIDLFEVKKIGNFFYLKIV